MGCDGKEREALASGYIYIVYWKTVHGSQGYVTTFPCLRTCNAERGSKHRRRVLLVVLRQVSTKDACSGLENSEEEEEEELYFGVDAGCACALLGSSM